MAKAGCGKVWLWQWRRSPLRRRSDVVEAWTVLVTWTLALLAGVLVGHSMAASVDENTAGRRASTHAVSAVLTENAADTASAKASGYDADAIWAKVRWTAADGSAHTGVTKVRPAGTAGTSVTVWTDDRSGDLVPGPPTASEARMEAAMAAALFGLSTAAIVLICGGLVRGRLERRRLAEWDAEWERLGPRWTKRMTG